MMKDIVQGNSQVILLIIIMVLVGWNIFTTNNIKTDVKDSEKKIENIQIKIDSSRLVDQQLKNKVIEVKDNITNITKEIHHIDNNLTIVKEKTNEKVNNVNNIGNVELERLFTARYK